MHIGFSFHCEKVSDSNVNVKKLGEYARRITHYSFDCFIPRQLRGLTHQKTCLMTRKRMFGGSNEVVHICTSFQVWNYIESWLKQCLYLCNTKLICSQHR